MISPVQRNIPLLRWFNFCAEFRLYSPVAILYYAGIAGSYALGMSVFSLTMLSQSLLEVPTGVLSDRMGRKWTVASGALASVLAVACYALAEGYPLLVIGALFEGLGRAFYSGNNEALLHDTLAQMGQRDEFRVWLGRTASAGQVALALGALLGGVVATTSFKTVYWLSLIPLVLALFFSLRMLEPQVFMRSEGNMLQHLRTALAQFRQNARLRRLGIAELLSFGLGEAAWQLRSAFVALLWPVWAIGFAQVLGNIGAALSFYFAGPALQRTGEYRVLVGGSALSTANNLIALVLASVISPALIALNSLLFGVNTVAKQTLLHREFTDEERATMGSLISFGSSGVMALFSLCLGILADWLGVIPALIISNLLGIIPLMLYWSVLRPRMAVNPA